MAALESPEELGPAAPPAPGELFKVVGMRAVYGVEPGDVGRLVLTPGQRFALIAGGHIRPAAAYASDSE